MFQGYQKAYHFDEVKIIGKDVCLDDVWIHIVGMGRKTEGTYLYILEEQPPWEENQEWKPGRTNRERMLDRKSEYNGKALHINKIMIGQDMFELQGGSLGSLAQQESVEGYFFFQQMMENGWRIPEGSWFYQLDWGRMGLAQLRLADSYETLPEFSGEVMQLTVSVTSRTHIVQIPVKLERGKTDELDFSLEDGQKVTCYINKVSMMEALKETREQFEDKDYQEKALQYVTKEQFEEMRAESLRMIESECPDGMGYFVVEYECTKDNFNAQFYDAKDLDSVPQPKEGTASVFMMSNKPAQETGPHGLRSRSATIQYAVPVGTGVMDAELFMLLETVPQKTYRVK